MKKRSSEKFLVTSVNTEKYSKSAIPQMKRLLNEYNLEISALNKFNPVNSSYPVTREYYFNSISQKI